MEALKARDQRIVPRGLNRDQAAAYIGVSASLFDTLVAKNLMPQARELESRRVWDILEIDRYFEDLPHVVASNSAVDKAGSASNDWN